jgi:hypothetical protein
MAAILLGVGLGAAVGGQVFSGLSAGKAAKEQARAQKQAANRYAKALRTQAARMQGGMSAARQRSMKAGAALDRAALGQMARDEAKRGGESPSIPLEARLAESLQQSMADQQKMIDQLSAQEAQTKAGQRQALRTQALQTKAQAQAIDPDAMARAARAPMYGQIGSTLGSAAIKLAGPTAMDQIEAKSLERQLAPLEGMDLGDDFDPSSLSSAAEMSAYSTYQNLFGGMN